MNYAARMPPPPRRFSQSPKPFPQGKAGAHRKAGPPPGRAAQDQGWDPVAAWYDKLVGDAGSDYHRQLILPAALRLLAMASGESVVDVCCGQGVLAKVLLELRIGGYLGVDASPRLIEAARRRHGVDGRARFLVADACGPGAWADGSHDAAACLMAVHDVRDLDGMLRNLSAALKPGGRAVLIFMHPCFRIPQQAHWGWDNDQKVQFRRVDRYVKPLEIPISTHPGRDSGEQTLFYHRPVSEVLNALGRAGLGVVASEELCSHRRSQSGPFSKAEHRAAEEFPLFLALKAVKLPAPR
jgi:SAM-dependent methyltransferase